MKKSAVEASLHCLHFYLYRSIECRITIFYKIDVLITEYINPHTLLFLSHDVNKPKRVLATTLDKIVLYEGSQ